MLALGIDPGTETTGYALVEENDQGDINAIDFGVIKTSRQLPDEKRLQIIYNELTRIISLHRPVTGAVEKLFFQKNVTNAMTVGQARGVILLAMANAGIEIGEYSPQQVKQAVTGYGAADKRQVQIMVQTMLSLTEIPKPDDAADALAVAICHIHSIGYKKRLESTQ
jgi:crossover junction endodeoxyribonuclease RuvC